MKYNLQAPPSSTIQNLAFEIPDLPSTITPVITGTTPIEPPNQLPVVNAGSNVTINLPINDVILTGSAMDTDGFIIKVLWEQISGNAANILTPNTTATKITGLTEGPYKFRLSATDDKGGTSFAETNVIVKAAIPLPTPSNYEGFGAKVTGGDNSPIVHVTTLSPTGNGSLGAAMGSNRKIVFDVQGTINGFRWTAASAGISNLTIDGGGITINGNAGSTFAFEGAACNNFILKNIRFGGSPGEDYVTITNGASNFVVDHCSFGTPGTDGLVGDGLCDITAGSHDGTVQYCFFGKSTAGSQLVAYSKTNNISLHHNLYAPAAVNQVGERNPLVHSSDTGTRTDLMVEYVNNLGYNWGRNNGTGSGYCAGVDYGGTIQCINNYFISKSAPDRAIDTNADPNAGNNGQCYAEGNVSGNAGVDPNKKSNHAKWTIPTYAQVTTLSAKDSANKVLAECGASPRLPAEQQLINTIIVAIV